MNENRDEEQEEKLRELKEKFEEVLQRIEELELSGDDSEEGPEDSITIESVDEPPFRVHWIDPAVETSFTCSYINTVKKAQEAFAEANDYRNANKLRINHGDVMILMCNSASGGDTCYYVGLCVVTNTPNQVEVPASPVITADSGTKEFIAWYTCPGENCACDESESIEELISGGIDEGSPDTSWKVSLGTCVWFNNVMSVSLYTSTTAGTTLLTKTRAFTLNKCGEIINIGKEVEDYLLIPCCDDEECPASYNLDLAAAGITDKATYVIDDSNVTIAGFTPMGPVTVTRLGVSNCGYWQDLNNLNPIVPRWDIVRAFSGLPPPPVQNAASPRLYLPGMGGSSHNFYRDIATGEVPGTYWVQGQVGHVSGFITVV